MDYQWMDNFSFGIDLAYYQPGSFYKKLIENDFRSGNDTGNTLKATYAGRWIAKVTF